MSGRKWESMAPTAVAAIVFALSAGALVFATITYYRRDVAGKRPDKPTPQGPKDRSRGEKARRPGLPASFLKPGAVASYDLIYNDELWVLKGTVSVEVSRRNGRLRARFKWGKCRSEFKGKKVDISPEGAEYVVPLNERGFPVEFSGKSEVMASPGMPMYALLGVLEPVTPKDAGGPVWHGDANVVLSAVDPEEAGPDVLARLDPDPSRRNPTATWKRPPYERTEGFLTYRMLSPEVRDGKAYDRVARLWRMRLSRDNGFNVVDWTDSAVVVVDRRKGMVVRASGKLVKQPLEVTASGTRELARYVQHYAFTLREEAR